MASDEKDKSVSQEDKTVIRPQKIYLKDASFESPNTPTIFTESWNPELAVDIENNASILFDNTYDVVLKIHAKATVEGITAFLVEVQQGGIFYLSGFSDERLENLQQVYCLRTLYPYACASVDSLVVKGGFPPINLDPINFKMRYQQMLEKAEFQNHDEEPE